MKKLMIALTAAAMALGLRAAPSVAGETFNDKTLEQLTGWTALGESSISSTAYSYSQSTGVDNPSALRGTEAGNNLAIKTAFSAPATWTFSTAGVTAGDAYVDTLVKFTACDEDATVPDGSNAKIMVWTKEILDSSDVVTGTNLYVTAGYLAADNTPSVKHYNCGSITKYNVLGDGNDWCRLTIKSFKNISTGTDNNVGFVLAVNGKEVTIAENFDIGVATSTALQNLTAKCQVWKDNNRLFPSLQPAGEYTLSAIGFAGQGAVDDIAIDAAVPYGANTTDTFLQDSAVFTLNWTAADVKALSYTVGGTKKTLDTSAEKAVIGADIGSAIAIDLTYADGKMAGEWVAEGATLSEQTFTTTADNATGTIVAQAIAATFNGNPYATLSEALDVANAIETAGTYTLKLGNAATETIQFQNENAGVKFELDLAGKNITVEGMVAIEVDAGEVKVIDSVGGAVVSASGDDQAVVSLTAGTCNIEAGTYADGKFDGKINLLYKEGATLKINVADNATVSGLGLPEGKMLKNNEETPAYWVLTDKPKASFTMILVENTTPQYKYGTMEAYADYTAKVEDLEPGVKVAWQYVAAAGYKITSETFSGEKELVAGDNELGVQVVVKHVGQGTEADPYLIYDVADLKAVKTGADSKDVYYQLANDIALTDDWTGIGAFDAKDNLEKTATYTAGAFQGNFNGADFTISGLKLQRGDYVGFFGSTYGATIKNLKVSFGSATGFGETSTSTDTASNYGGGAIVGVSVNTTIENCQTLKAGDYTTFKGTKAIGGIVGYAAKGTTVKNCVNNLNLETTNEKCGGIMAIAQNTGSWNFADVVIDSCTNNGNVYCSTSAKMRVGGLCSYTDIKVVFKGANAVTGTLTQNGGNAYSIASPNSGSVELADGATFTVPAANMTINSGKAVDGLFFATVADGVATLVKNADLVKDGSVTYKVMAAGATVALANVGDKIALDETLATATVTSPDGTKVVQNGNVYEVKAAEAKIGSVFYLTFAEAYEAAKENDTIEVLQNITLASTLNVATAITIDFGGKTVTLPASGDGIKVTAAATIKNGTLNSTLAANTVAYALHSYKTNATYENLVINGANYRFVVYAEGADTVAACYGDNDPTTTVECKNVDVKGNGTLFEAEFTKMNLDANCSAIAEGTPWNYEAAIYSAGNATVTIAGGTYTHTKALLSGNLGGKIVVNGGAFTGSIYSWMQSTAHSEYNEDPKYWAYFTLNAGTFTGAIEFKEAGDAARALDVFTKATDVALAAPTDYEWNSEGKLVKKSEGPTPGAGSEVSVDPVAGEDNTYKVEPTGTSKDVVVDGVKSGDTLVIDGSKVDSIGVNATEGVTIKVMNKAGTTDISAACKGFSGNKFDAALDGTKEVKIGEETISVTPTVTEATDGTIADGAMATKAIPGLTYTLQRMPTLGGTKTPVASATATETTVSLKDTTEKPTDKAFYVIEVTK